MYVKKNTTQALKIFIDVETTGFNPWKHSVLSMAICLVDDELNTVAEFYEECRPNLLTKATWTVEAQRVHGFTPQEVRNKQTEKGLCEKLYNFLEENMVGRGKLYFHADSKIDYKFLIGILFKNMGSRYYDIYKYMEPYGHINTMEYFRACGFRKYGLDKMARHYNIKLNHHNALSDTRVLVEIYKRVKQEELNKAA